MLMGDDDVVTFNDDGSIGGAVAICRARSGRGQNMTIECCW
jgi:hypothetical protein